MKVKCANLFLWIVGTASIHVSKPPSALTHKIQENSDDGEWVTVSENWGNQKKAILDSYNLTARNPGDIVKKNQSAYPAKDKCLIVYHVAKSAGESLQRWFDDNDIKFWSHYSPINESEALPYSDRGLGKGKFRFHEVDVYMGHWTPQVTNSLLSKSNLGRNCYEVTVLRNPFERTSSMLFWAQPWRSLTGFIPMLKDPKYRMNHPQFGNRREYGEPLFYQDARWYFDDMCRQFSGLTTTWNQFNHDYSHNLNSTCNVELAKASLLKLDLVGFVEDIDSFIGTIGDMLGLPKNRRKSIQFKNVSKNPTFKALPHKLQKLISHANAADSELYAWAAQTFVG